MLMSLIFYIHVHLWIHANCSIDDQTKRLLLGAQSLNINNVRNDTKKPKQNTAAGTHALLRVQAGCTCCYVHKLAARAATSHKLAARAATSHKLAARAATCTSWLHLLLRRTSLNIGSKESKRSYM